MKTKPSLRRLAHAMGMALLLSHAAPGCTDDDPPCSRAALEPLEEEPAYVVLASDYTSSAIALLDAEGELVTEAWVDSGTTDPALVMTLSGDVVLPTSNVTAGALTWIDRGLDIVTRVSVPDGQVLDQTSVVLPMQPDEGAFFGNPHDVLPAAQQGRAWVSRFEPNLDASAAELDRGNDLVLVDFGTGEPVDRIGLDALDASVMSDGMSVRAVARPSRMTRAGPRIVAGLARLSVDFMTTGPGAVAVVDPGERTAEAVELEGLTNCDEVAPVRGDDHRALAVCSGPAFVDEAGRRAEAGIALLHVDDTGALTVESLWRAADHPNAPVPTHGVLSLDGTRLLAVAMGDAEAQGDRLLELDLAGGEPRVVLEAAEAFVLADGTYDESRDLVLWTDALEGIRRLDVSPSEVTTRDTVAVSPCRGLGARQIEPVL